MRVLGNVVWLVLAGLWLAISYAAAGLLAVVSIVGIPFGLQAFKLAGYALWPFGRVVIDAPGADRAIGVIGDVIWLVLGGWWIALLQLALGLVLFVTVIGIPFGVASLRMAVLALAPFGKTIVSERDVPRGARVVVGPLRRR